MPLTVAIALTGNLTAEQAAKPGSWIAYAAAGLVLLGTICGTYYLCCVLDRRDQNRRDSAEGDGEGGGGAKRGGGRTPPKAPSGTDPEWWPEFERQFADHVGGWVTHAPARNSAGDRGRASTA